MIPLFERDGKQTKPLGFPMCQNRMAVPVWSYAMEVYEPRRILEIGSLNGGFTTALAVHAYNIRPYCSIHSYDTSQSPDEEWIQLSKFLGIRFVKANVFEEIQPIQNFISTVGTTFLLCDGGDKPREFKTFAPFLKSGDVIGVHDYCPDVGSGEASVWPWSEVTKEDVAQTVTECGLEPWMQEHFDLCGWLVYKKK